MIKYDYKCVLCTCMYAREEVDGFYCTLCEPNLHTDSYICRKCLKKYGKKNANQIFSNSNKEIGEKVLRLHRQEFHYPVDIF